MDYGALKVNLEKRRFRVSSFPTAAAAAEYLSEEIRGETVGFGGSVTLQEMGLYEKLSGANRVIWHWKDVADRDRFPEFTAYVTSVNAIAETGELVNIDGTGNRLSACLYGPKKVYFVVGRNKVTPDLQSAMDRARNVASPQNCRRLKLATPCVKTGVCHDCASPQRACGAMCIHMCPMLGSERTEVVLIDEDLGY